MQGNYKGYYKRRQQPDRHEFLREDWFAGKACLDIGCNEGVLTATIAEKFRPRFILGIDSDRLLIEAASSRLKRIKYNFTHRDNDCSSKVADETERPTKKRPMLLFTPRTLVTKSTAERSKNPMSLDEQDSLQEPKTVVESCCSYVKSASQEQHDPFPFNFTFLHRDIFSLDVSGGSRYDTILCLSISKWIHLYHGDAGLIRFFQIMFDLLRLDGILIFEYQPWRSYEKRKNISNVTEDIFKTIEIFPEMFEIVLQELGFMTVEKFGPSEEEAKGFNRPILVLRKAKADSSVSISLLKTKLSASKINHS